MGKVVLGRIGPRLKDGSFISRANQKKTGTFVQLYLDEYKSWQHARSRCTNPDDPKFQSYGGRGITFCERWLNDFSAFVRDMGPRPQPKAAYSLDRIDNDLGYEPANCRWTTRVQQARNKRWSRPARFFLKEAKTAFLYGKHEYRAGTEAEIIKAFTRLEELLGQESPPSDGVDICRRETQCQLR